MVGDGRAMEEREAERELSQSLSVISLCDVFVCVNPLAVAQSVTVTSQFLFIGICASSSR